MCMCHGQAMMYPLCLPISIPTMHPKNGCIFLAGKRMLTPPKDGITNLSLNKKIPIIPSPSNPMT